MMGLFVAAMVVGAPLVTKGPLWYVAYSVALVSVLVGICYWKGEKPEWSWGSRE